MNTCSITFAMFQLFAGVVAVTKAVRANDEYVECDDAGYCHISWPLVFGCCWYCGKFECHTVVETGIQLR
jgi:hypothetical protein